MIDSGKPQGRWSVREHTTSIIWNCSKFPYNMYPYPVIAWYTLSLGDLLSFWMSRPKLYIYSSGEWSLDNALFDRFCRQFVLLDIHLFASRLNCKISTHVSCGPDPCSFATYAFSLLWHNFSPCLFCLISRTSYKTKEHRTQCGSGFMRSSIVAKLGMATYTTQYCGRCPSSFSAMQTSAADIQ